jgi:uncharacterized protein YaeQ
MALKATICKAELHIADMERGYYHDHTLTVARHPSETDERMMVRLLAFALHADETLAFGAGLSTDDEPDLWRKDLTGSIQTWIDVGLPDEKRIRKACGRADEVFVYAYGGHASQLWWQQAGDKLARSHKLTVIDLPQAGTRAPRRTRHPQHATAVHHPGRTDMGIRPARVGPVGPAYAAGVQTRMGLAC